MERVELDDPLARSDFLSVNCPLTAQTRSLLSDEKLRLMKITAYLVNTGRGAVIDEAALCIALKQRRLAGAALDVFVNEPLPRASPLRDAPNLIMTPHAIGGSDEMYAEYMESVAVAIIQFMSGHCPSDAINPEAFRKYRGSAARSPFLIALFSRFGCTALRRRTRYMMLETIGRMGDDPPISLPGRRAW